MTPSLVTECLVCRAALGAESRDMDYRVCQLHRKCAKCDDSLTPREVHAAQRECEESYGTLENLAPLLLHPRCSILSRAPQGEAAVTLSQSHVDYLNNIRLLWEVEADLSPEHNERQADLQCAKLLINATLEEKFLHLAKMQSAVAHLSIALAKDKTRIKQALDIRESKKFEAAKRQASTSARPSVKVSENEIVLAEFMRLNDIKERTVGKRLWTQRSNAIQHFVTSGVPKASATQLVDEMMIKNGQLKRQGEQK